MEKIVAIKLVPDDSSGDYGLGYVVAERKGRKQWYIGRRHKINLLEGLSGKWKGWDVYEGYKQLIPLLRYGIIEW